MPKAFDETFEHFVQDRYPWIDWRQPIKISLMGTAITGFGCRFCIAKNGLKGSDVPNLPKTEEECQRHIEEMHR